MWRVLFAVLLSEVGDTGGKLEVKWVVDEKRKELMMRIRL